MDGPSGTLEGSIGMARVDATLGLNTRPFQQGLDRAKGSLDAFSRGASSAMKSWAAGLSLVGIGASVRATIEEFDRLNDLAERFGLSAETMQRIGYAAKVTGADIETVARALAIANRNAQTAATSGGQVAEAFKRLGINAVEFAGLDQQGQLEALADAFAGAADKNMVLADALQIMGRSGAELVPLLAQGADGVRELGKNAEIASEESIKMIAGLDDRIDAATTKAKALGAALIAYVGGALLGLWESIKRFGEGWAALFMGDWEHFKNTIPEAFEAFGKPFDDAAEAANKATQAIVDDFDQQAGAAEASAKRKEDAFKSFYDQRQKDIEAVKRQEDEANEFRWDSLRAQEDAEWAAMKRQERWQDEAAEARREREQGAARDRLGVLDRFLERMTASDTLQSVGLGFRGVNYGDRTVSEIQRMREVLAGKLDKLTDAVESNEFTLYEDEF